MGHTNTAKVFMTGRSQAVRLPAAFRFDSDEVFIRRDETTGDVVLSARPDSWDGFFAALSKTEVPASFLGEADRQQSETSRDPLDRVDD